MGASDREREREEAHAGSMSEQTGRALLEQMEARQARQARERDEVRDADEEKARLRRVVQEVRAEEKRLASAGAFDDAGPEFREYDPFVTARAAPPAGQSMIDPSTLSTLERLTTDRLTEGTAQALIDALQENRRALSDLHIAISNLCEMVKRCNIDAQVRAL